MSEKEQKDRPGVSWKTIERVADRAGREEMQRLGEMTDEELDAELGEAGFAPDAAARLVEAALAKADAPAKPPPQVVSLAAEREKRRRPVGLLLLVAAVAVAVVGGGATLVALNTPEPPPTTPVPTVPTAPPGPPPALLARQQREKAEGLRKEARARCDEGAWGECQRSLATAASLDPAGDETRAVQRLRTKATRGAFEDQLEAKGGALGPRVVDAEGTKRLVKALEPARGQAVKLVCARGAEPAHLCGQLAAALAKAGWTVTRAATAPGDAGEPLGVHVEITTDAGDAAQAAADALADGLEAAPLRVHGPDNLPPGGDAPLRLTVGTQ